MATLTTLKVISTEQEIERPDPRVDDLTIPIRSPFTSGLTYHIITYGCQMNVADSDRMEALLQEAGYTPAESEDQADVILINTCSVRAKPEDKVWSKLGELRRLKERKPHLTVGVCGCMAQRVGEELQHHSPGVVDLVIGTGNVERIVELIEQTRNTRHPLVALELPKTRQEALSWTPRGSRLGAQVKLKEFVPIIEGCDKFCTFCIVPYTRGRERSRPMEDILADVEYLAAHGCKEIILLGQTVNAYGMAEDGGHRKARPHFAYLLERLNEVPGIERIRFTSSHPADFREEMIEAVAHLPKVCEWIHLPFQAGDNEILKRMWRNYTREEYLDLIHRIRQRIPQVALTTDIIVGFPGETEEQFQRTLDLVREVRFDSAFMFAFSPRPGTPAASFPDQVPREVKRDRLHRLIELQNQITLEINQSQVGQVFEVLVEGSSPKTPELLTGLTRTNKTVNFPGSKDLIGRLVWVKAVEAHPWGFMGELISS